MTDTLRAIIIDDELDGVKALTLIVQKFIKDVEVIASSTNAIEGIKFINNYQPDIVFLDINMPILDGFQVLDNLDFKQFSLVFTTAHSEFGLKALKNGAVDYLLKPINIGELQLTIERIKNTRRHPVHKIDLGLLLDLIHVDAFKISVPTRNSVEYVFAKDIVYIEADNHNSKVTLANLNNEILSLKALKDYEVNLCKADSFFIRLHNSFIVNVNFVHRYLKENGGYIVTQNNKKIPVSKNKKTELLKAIHIIEEDPNQAGPGL
jgi:two-component system LytT family response regulator